MSIASPKQKKRYSLCNMTCNAPEQPPQAEVERLNVQRRRSGHIQKEQHPQKLLEIWQKERRAASVFLIIDVSYNARYAKLREAKKAHFPDFWRFSLGWLIFWLGLTVLRILHFLSYFIVLFVSRLQILPVLCAAESVRLWFMLVRLFLQRLWVCFIMFHAAFYDLQFAAVVDHSSWFLCGHGLVCFCQNLLRMLLYGCWLLTL